MIRKALFVFIILMLALSFIKGMGTGNPLTFVLLMGLLLLVFCMLKSNFRTLFEIYSTPFRFLHRLLTNSFPDGPNAIWMENGKYKVHYPNTFQFVFFGIFGNVLYYGIFFSIFFLIFAYKPYDDGYVCKQYDYEIGETVLIKDDKEQFLAQVESCEVDDETKVAYFVVSKDGEDMEARFSYFDTEYGEKTAYIKGAYKEDGSGFATQFGKSAWGFVSYTAKRLPRMAYLIAQDFK